MPVNRKREKKSPLGTFGKRLSKSRKDKGLKQSELAEMLGYSQNSAISDIERDITPVNNLALMRISEILDVDLHWLITGKPSPISNKIYSHLEEIVIKMAPYVNSDMAHIIEQNVRYHETLYLLKNKEDKCEDDFREIEKLENLYEESCMLYKKMVSDMKLLNDLLLVGK